MGHINGLHVLIFVLVVAVITIVVIARSPQAPQHQETPEPPNPITYYTTFRQRALMGAFIANVMGYGTNSHRFKQVRSSALIHLNAYGHLVDALENARRVLNIPAGEMSHEMQEYFMDCLADDEGFILNCARYADFIENLVASSWHSTAPDELIIDNDVVVAFRRLRDHMWPTEDFSRQG